MTYDELLETIAASKDEDWVATGRSGEEVYVYKGNVDVRLEKLPDPADMIEAYPDPTIRREELSISQDWAQRAVGDPSRRSYHAFFGLFHGATLVEEVSMAEIIFEGSFVYIPFPDYRGETTSGPVVREWQRTLAVVATSEGFRNDFGSFFERSGIAVEG